MKSDVYIFENGELKRKDNTVYFEGENKRKFIPIEETSNIWIYGEVDLNKRFLDYASEKGVCLHFFNYYGYYTGTFYPREHLNSGFVILKQAAFYLDSDKRLNIAKEFIKTAIMNMIVILKYYKNRGTLLEGEINDINEKNKMIDEVSSVNELMAYEGNIRELYYKCFDKIINKSEFQFEKRSRRPPLNKLNSLISFGNSMMYAEVLSQIYNTQLDPRIGYLHSTNERRFTLNLDVSEIFKPIIVDRTIFTILNRNIINDGDFMKELNGILLNDSGKKKFIQEYNKKLFTTISHAALNNEVTYKRIIRMELYKLQKHITEGKEYKGFTARW